MTERQRLARIKMGKIYLKEYPTIREGGKFFIYLDEIIVYYSLN